MRPPDQRSPRLLLETSVIVTYLAPRNPSNTAGRRLLELAATGQVTLLWAPPTIDGVACKVAGNSDLRRSIDENLLRARLAVMRELSESLPAVDGPYPPICRDSGDDDIIAHALAGSVDTVVTLDRDLLALGDFDGLLSVKPGGAFALLRAEGFAGL